MKRDSKIFVAGHRGLVGSAITRRLRAGGFERLLVADRGALDLRDQAAVTAFFERERPEYVFLAAARVGGILANSTHPAEFIRDNLLIQTNVIDSAWRAQATRLLFLGSSCIYPRLAPQPMTEDSLLSGPLEPTNEAYAIAKIAGIKMVEAYRKQHGMSAVSLMPTNLYGPGDNFDVETSHVLPALLRKFHEARVAGAPTVTVWGTGAPRREFLHVDDLADASVFLMERGVDEELINVGVGKDISIAQLASLVAEIVGFTGEIVYDHSKPDGTPRKLLDVTRLERLGWSPRIELREGIQATYRWFVEHQAGAAP
jgi:GDP-L-fucose synthase